MKASTKHLTRTPKRSTTATERLYAQYVRDLRLLLEQSARREEKLAGMVQAVIDERFFRPVVTSDRPQSQHVGNEMQSDVEVFDAEEDGRIMQKQTLTAKDAAREFASIFREQTGEEPPAERHQEELQNA